MMLKLLCLSSDWLWLACLNRFSVQLLNIEHLQSFTAQRSEPLVDAHIDWPNHQLKETAGQICCRVGFAGRDSKSAGHIVYTSVAHLFDLHQDRDHLFDLTAEVMLEDLLMDVKDLD